MAIIKKFCDSLTFAKFDYDSCQNEVFDVFRGICNFLLAGISIICFFTTMNRNVTYAKPKLAVFCERITELTGRRQRGPMRVRFVGVNKNENCSMPTEKTPPVLKDEINPYYT